MIKSLKETKFFRIFCLYLLILALILSFNPPTLAQLLPNLGGSDNNSPTDQSSIPVFELGNLEVAPVFLDGRQVGVVDAFRTSLLPQDSDRPKAYGASVRSQIINSRLQKILDNMTRYSRDVLSRQGITDLEGQEQELSEQLSVNPVQKQGSWAVTATFPKDDVPEIIYSVTKAEIDKPRFGGSQPEKIAERAAKMIKTELIKAWRERKTPYLISAAQRALLTFSGLGVISLILYWRQKTFTKKQQRLDDILITPEVGQLDPMKPTESLESSEESSDDVEQLTEERPKISIIEIKQRYRLNSLYRSALFWMQWLLWLIGIGYLTSLFYWTRPLSNWIIGVSISRVWSQADGFYWPPLDWLRTFGQQATLGTPLLILLLLMITRLTLKIGDAMSQTLAQKWVYSVSIRQQRHQLRISTLGQAFRGWLRVVVYLFVGGIIAYHLHQLGAITSVVAVFLGFISFALSLASQDLLKDLITGLLILWEDQYAVGDVIIINEQGGLVENISLRVTQLRNLDGELITFPNRTIEMVRNLSSEWSRVNYAIEVSYDANVDHVLQVMEQVGQELYEDPNWQDPILEAPEILGIDEMSHKGILIRLIIKTQPLQQWSVAREFRRRLKNVFDQQGIKVGIPQQKMYLNEEISNGHQPNFPLATLSKE